MVQETHASWGHGDLPVPKQPVRSMFPQLVTAIVGLQVEL